MSVTLPKDECHGLAQVMRAFSELNEMAPIESQRPYVEQAVSAARMALAIYRTKPRQDATLLAEFEKSFRAVEVLSDLHARGDATLSAVVYPARKLAYRIGAKNDEADQAPAVT